MFALCIYHKDHDRSICDIWCMENSTTQTLANGGHHVTEICFMNIKYYHVQ
jgi:hypothetical protein